MYNSSNLSVAKGGFLITPHDVNNFGTRVRAIYVGTGGDINVVGGDGVAFLMKAVPQGSVIPVEAIRVNAANTTAALLVGLV